jgi:hypothetical protein
VDTSTRRTTWLPLAAVLVVAGLLGACSSTSNATPPLAVHLRGWQLNSGDKALSEHCGPYVQTVEFGNAVRAATPARAVSAKLANFYVCAPKTPFTGTYQVVPVAAALKIRLARLLGGPDRPFSNQVCVASLVMPVGGFPEVIARSTDGRYWLIDVPLGACSERNVKAQTLIAQVLGTTAVK